MFNTQLPDGAAARAAALPRRPQGRVRDSKEGDVAQDFEGEPQDRGQAGENF